MHRRHATATQHVAIVAAARFTKGPHTADRPDRCLADSQNRSCCLRRRTDLLRGTAHVMSAVHTLLWRRTDRQELHVRATPQGCSHMAQAGPTH
jgi:hypothetical protein